MAVWADNGDLGLSRFRFRFRLVSRFRPMLCGITEVRVKFFVCVA